MSVASFFSHSWFTRVWIIQEYVQCSRLKTGRDEEFENEPVEFYCGTTRVSPAILVHVVNHDEWLTLPKFKWSDIKPQAVNNIKSPFNSVDMGILCFHNILHHAITPIIATTKELMAWQFFRAILGGLACNLTDPRDRIYAYLPFQSGHNDISLNTNSVESYAESLGLSRFDAAKYLTQQIQSAVSYFSILIVDYVASIEDVYSNFTTYMILATGSLNILSLCHRRSSDISRTWTIDLTAITHFEAGCIQDSGLLASSIVSEDKPSPFRASSNAVVSGAKVTNRFSVLSIKG